MPQPVQHYRAISFEFYPDAILQRPTLAPYIGRIAAHWNELEAQMAVLLAALLGSEAKTVISVFLALKADVAKKTTLDTVTELKLPPADLEKFREIQKTLGRRYSERNTAIHGAWGVSPEYPDKLLWSDIRDSTAMLTDIMPLSDPSKRAERIARMLEQQKRLMVYEERDFQDIVARMKAAITELGDFGRPYVRKAFAPA
jgi:hypothetical protein